MLERCLAETHDPFFRHNHAEISAIRKQIGDVLRLKRGSKEAGPAWEALQRRLQALQAARGAYVADLWRLDAEIKAKRAALREAARVAMADPAGDQRPAGSPRDAPRLPAPPLLSRTGTGAVASAVDWWVKAFDLRNDEPG